jgi:hypothetical protein
MNKKVLLYRFNDMLNFITSEHNYIHFQGRYCQCNTVSDCFNYVTEISPRNKQLPKNRECECIIQQQYKACRTLYKMEYLWGISLVRNNPPSLSIATQSSIDSLGFTSVPSSVDS